MRPFIYSVLCVFNPSSVVLTLSWRPSQTNSGSHCPFLDGWLLPFTRDPVSGPLGVMLESYADRATAEFFCACLEEWSAVAAAFAEEGEGEGR